MMPISMRRTVAPMNWTKDKCAHQMRPLNNLADQGEFPERETSPEADSRSGSAGGPTAIRWVGSR